MYQIVDEAVHAAANSPTIIKVVGVGGAGGNAVEHMIREGVTGVEFICANTDAQALRRCSATTKLQLGPGLGAGGKPEKARDLAVAERARIAEMLDGAHMVFITAGMGGGTGTGAAPVIAEVAREKGILTVGVVSKPFEFEGRRMRLAEDGLIELGNHVDSLIVILNEKLMEVLGDEVSMTDAFRAADEVLRNAVGGISEIINVPGLVNVDFEDVRTVLGETGKAMMGSAVASGVDRARLAAEEAVASPLLEGIELSGARGVLVNISASRDLGMKEVKEVMSAIRNYASPDATIIFGTVFDEAMADMLRVTVVATGLDAPIEMRGVRGRPMLVPASAMSAELRTGTDDRPIVASGNIDDSFITSRRSARNMADLDLPPWERGAAPVPAIDRVADSGDYEIPSFLRRQAD